MIRRHRFRFSDFRNKVRIARPERGIEHEEGSGDTPSRKGERVAKRPIGRVPSLKADGARPAFARVNEGRRAATVAGRT